MHHKSESDKFKRYALLMSLVLCLIAPVFEGAANVAGGTASTTTGAMDGRTASNSSMANRVSKPGEYAGYSEAIYDDKYELTSQYVQVSDGTKLAMDLYRPKDKATGKVIDADSSRDPGRLVFLPPVVDARAPSRQNHIPAHHEIRHKPCRLAPAPGNNDVY